MRFVLLALTLSAALSAAVVTFESAPAGPLATYTEAGITFTPVGGGSMLFTPGPNGTTSLLEDSSPRRQIRAEVGLGTNFVSVDLGDFAVDADLLTLSVFDSSNALLAAVTELIAADFNGMRTLSVSASNIAYAIVGSTTPSNNGSSVYIDNFTTSAVPEPGTASLFAAAALSVLALARLRRK
jgi:hypothetical protein